MINDTTYAALLAIMINRINLDGKCDDEEVCKDIAAYLNMLNGEASQFGHTLWEFIYDYGEDSDDIFMGRDEEGEKVYHTTNKETNWHERIRKELVRLGYYDRQKAA